MSCPKYVYFVLAFFVSLESMAISMKFNGYDIKKKSEMYELELGPLNDLLDERKFKLKSLNSKKIQLQGEVVSVPSSHEYDISSFYKNSMISIQMGPVANDDNHKQILVVKIFNLNNVLTQKTIFFEANGPINE